MYKRIPYYAGYLALLLLLLWFCLMSATTLKKKATTSFDLCYLARCAICVVLLLLFTCGCSAETKSERVFVLFLFLLLLLLVPPLLPLRLPHCVSSACGSGLCKCICICFCICICWCISIWQIFNLHLHQSVRQTCFIVHKSRAIFWSLISVFRFLSQFLRLGIFIVGRYTSRTCPSRSY